MDEYTVIQDGNVWLAAKRNKGARWGYLFWSDDHYWSECISKSKLFDSEESAQAQLSLLLTSVTA